MISYGDDNLFSIAQEILEWFNFETISETMPDFGMTYTSENKDGAMYKYKSLQECSFLQRGFRFDSSGYWLGPLKQNSINESLNWMMKNSQPVEALKQSLNGAVAEWALHDSETFELWSRKISRVACEKLNVVIPTYPHSWYINTLLWGDYYKHFPMLNFV